MASDGLASYAPACDDMKIPQKLSCGLLTLAALLSDGCSSQLPKTTTASAVPIKLATSRMRSQPERDTADPAVPAKEGSVLEFNASENIAFRILKSDAQVNPVTDQMFQTLKEVVDDACASIGKLNRKENGRWDRRCAEATLRCIDAALINHGFLYPDAGGVDQLADGLTPFQMSAARRPAFETQSHNRRRVRMISERFPGPFYAVDCDIASFIYLGVADQLRLPLNLVVIPSYNRRPGHTFVRWREGSHYLDWETMDGLALTDEFYVREWNLNFDEIKAKSALASLSTDQVMGCEHYLMAIQYERRKDYEQALRELSVALELYPQNLDSRREFAWVTATGVGVHVRNNSDAIADAKFVLNLVNDPDTRDTLAAAYASAGMFDLAVREERAAISNSASSIESQFGYKQRLRLYQRSVVYRQPSNEHE